MKLQTKTEILRAVNKARKDIKFASLVSSMAIGTILFFGGCTEYNKNVQNKFDNYKISQQVVVEATESLNTDKVLKDILSIVNDDSKSYQDIIKTIKSETAQSLSESDIYTLLRPSLESSIDKNGGFKSKNFEIKNSILHTLMKKKSKLYQGSLSEEEYNQILNYAIAYGIQESRDINEFNINSLNVFNALKAKAYAGTLDKNKDLNLIINEIMIYNNYIVETNEFTDINLLNSFKGLNDNFFVKPRVNSYYSDIIEELTDKLKTSKEKIGLVQNTNSKEAEYWRHQTELLTNYIKEFNALKAIVQENNALFNSITERNDFEEKIDKAIKSNIPLDTLQEDPKIQSSHNNFLANYYLLNYWLQNNAKTKSIFRSSYKSNPSRSGGG